MRAQQWFITLFNGFLNDMQAVVMLVTPCSSPTAVNQMESVQSLNFRRGFQPQKQFWSKILSLEFQFFLSAEWCMNHARSQSHPNGYIDVNDGCWRPRTIKSILYLCERKIFYSPNTRQSSLAVIRLNYDYVFSFIDSLSEVLIQLW